MATILEIPCPNPSWPADMPTSLHYTETAEGKPCLGCGAVV